MLTPANASPTPAAPATLDPDLVRLLRCPMTKSPLRLEGEFLVAEVGGIKYPVREGIPVMLVEEAVLPEGVASLEEYKKKFGK